MEKIIKHLIKKIMWKKIYKKSYDRAQKNSPVAKSKGWECGRVVWRILEKGDRSD